MNKEYVYSDLFKLLPQSFKVSKRELVPAGKTPAYSSDTRNNGRVGFVDREPLFKITEKAPVYLVFGDHTRTMNIVHEDFCVMDNVKVLVPLVEMPDEVLLYIITCWKKAIPNLGYARHWSVAKKARFELPVVESSNSNHQYTVNDIDYEYMQKRITEIEQERIAELEQERIAELDAYLMASGLDDYELTDEDKKILALSPESVSDESDASEADCRNGQIAFKAFKVGDVFNKLEAKCKKADFDKRRDTSTVPNEEYCVPLVNAKFGDNGIMFYGRKSDWDTQEMCIDVIQNGAVATGTVYVQPQPVGVLWDAYLIKPVAEVKTTEALLYMAKCIEKITKEQFSYDKKATWDRVKLCEVSLPVTSDGNINFDYMERYIRAIEKLAIADVAKCKDKLIATTRRVVGA